MKIRKLPRPSLGHIWWILLIGFIGYRITPQVQAAVGAGSGSSEAPGLSVRTLSGDTVVLERYRGQVVLLNFWATWCPPCRGEMPGFQRVYEDRRADGFVVLGLSTDRGGADGVRDFLMERGITFPVAIENGEAARAFGGVNMLPTSILIDREGRVRQEIRGIFAEPALRLAVNRLLREEPDLEAPGGAS